VTYEIRSNVTYIKGICGFAKYGRNPKELAVLNRDDIKKDVRNFDKCERNLMDRFWRREELADVRKYIKISVTACRETHEGKIPVLRTIIKR
jgi:hypothetical protein